MQGLLNEVQEYRDRMVEWRRNIHSCPETGFHLPKRHRPWWRKCWRIWDFSAPDLQKALSWNPGNRQAGKYIAVRADMDALGMQDEGCALPLCRDRVCMPAATTHTYSLCWAGILSFRAQDQIRRMCQTDFQPAEKVLRLAGQAHRGFRGGRRGRYSSPLPASISAGVMGCRYGAFASGDFSSKA